MSDNSERDAALALRRKAMMEADFDPGYTPERTPQPDVRLAIAAEYAAYQLGQINRNIARLVDLLEKRGGG